MDEYTWNKPEDREDGFRPENGSTEEGITESVREVTTDLQECASDAENVLSEAAESTQETPENVQEMSESVQETAESVQETAESAQETVVNDLKDAEAVSDPFGSESDPFEKTLDPSETAANHFEDHAGNHRAYEDMYADGTPVRPAGGYPNYRYQSEWVRRQTDPLPYKERNGQTKKKRSGKVTAIIAIILVAAMLTGIIAMGFRMAGSWITGTEQASTAESAPSSEAAAPAESSASSAAGSSSNESIREIPTLSPSKPETESKSAGSTKSVADVAEECMPAMVAITTMSIQQVYSFYGNQTQEVQGAGSGIIVGATDTELLIATNNHVVYGAKSLSVCFVDDSVVSASVKGTDATNDLAIVAVLIDEIDEETRSKIGIITIGDSDSLRIGDQVVAIGNALGFGQSVSAGVVSALNRTVTVDDEPHVLMQTDAAINPGNSGGALLNMNGELVGINEVKYVAEDTEGIGYAIPITFAKPILDELMNRETRVKADEDNRGYLGISCLTVASGFSSAYRIPVGVYIDSVVEGGAADRAGLRARDVITKIGDTEVTTSEELIEELSYYASGETVSITFSRLGMNNEYQEMVIDVTLDLRPADLDSQTDGQPQGGGRQSP